MGLEEQELRKWGRRVVNGEASRRHFLRTILGLGLSGPLLADLLVTAAPADAQGTHDAPQAFTPTRREVGRHPPCGMRVLCLLRSERAW